MENNFLNEIKGAIGIESTNVAVGSEFERDMAQLSDFVNLTLDLETAGVESSVAMVEEGAGIIAGLEGISPSFAESLGLEAQAVDVAKQGFYRFKTVLKSLFRTVKNFCKKMLSLGGVSEKSVTALKSKHKAYKKKWDAGKSKLKLSDDKDYPSIGNSVQVALKALVQSDAEKKELSDYISELNTAFETRAKAIVFVNQSNDTFSTLKEGVKSDSIKEFKEKYADMIKDIEKEDLSHTQLVGAINGALTETIKVIEDVKGAKAEKQIKDLIKKVDKMEKEIGKMKESEVTATGEDVHAKAVKKISKLAEVLLKLPTIEGMHNRQVILVSQKVFTEVDRVLAL